MVCSVGGGGGAVTVSDAVPLTPENEAVIVSGPPAATPVATPVLLTMVASLGMAEVHAACVVRFCVEPSEYLPVAVKATVVPTVIVSGFGVTTIDCSVGGGGGG